jgi:hypothetical protein
MNFPLIKGIVAGVMSKQSLHGLSEDAVVSLVTQDAWTADLVVADLQAGRSRNTKYVASATINPSSEAEIRKAFTDWNIDAAKFAQFYGGQTEDDAVKLVQAFRDPVTTAGPLWREMLRLYVIGSVVPESEMVTKA